MNKKTKFYIVVGLSALTAIILLYIFRAEIYAKSNYYYKALSDKEKVENFILSFGAGAPLIFIILQIAQVIFAPIPGEASGFIGGYLFGVLWGFVYSSIGLSIGSIINFAIGSFLGKKYIKKLIPEKYIDKFNRLLSKEGIIVILIFFIFPGFPKDLLCLFLGLSGMMKWGLFLLMSSVGRMPGTLLLSIQGAYVSQKLYWHFATVFLLCVILVFLSYKYRDKIYKFTKKN
ncbi:MAG: TVP38/TMEM64 family protein [Deltaproteobacteria bacterium]|nr:TVP38/TMEM64 family protein [Deltaproteobacteria bacterium]